MAENNRDEMVNSFVDKTGATRVVAAQFLETANWQLRIFRSLLSTEPQTNGFRFVPN